MCEHVKHVSADVQKIYSRIGDNISKSIFEDRLLMTLIKNNRTSNETEFLREKRNKDRRLAELFNEIKHFGGDTLIYGAGECGRYLYESDFMQEISVRGFIDNKEWPKETIHNTPVYSFEEAVKLFEKANIILSMQSGVSRKQTREQITRSKPDWKILDAGAVLQEIDKERLLDVKNPYYKFIYNLVNTSVQGAELFSKIMRPVHPIACWITFQEGDTIGKLIKEKWGYLPWQCYLTGNKRKNEYNGIPVYTYEEALTQYDQLDIVIESAYEGKTVRDQIASFGTKGECISLEDITEMLNRQQYFDFFES